MFSKRLLALTLFVSALAAMPTCVLRAQWVQTSGVFPGLPIVGLAANGQNIVAGATPQNGLLWIDCYFSTDGGTSWKKGNGPFSIHSFVTIGNTFFGIDGQGYGIYRSNDHGADWDDWSYANNQIGESVTSLGTDSLNLFAGTLDKGIYIYDSSTGAWNQTNAGLPKISGDFPTIRTFATMGTMLFAGTDNGLFRSTNHGNSWQSINDGLKTYYTDGCAGLAISDSILIYASGDGGVFTSTDGGIHWSPSNTGMPVGYIAAIAVNGPKLFVSLYGADTNGLFRSTNNGKSWSLITEGLPGYTSISAIAFCGSKLFAGTKCAGIFASSDSGLTWSAANNSDLLIQSRCSKLAENDDGIYAGFDYYNLFLSTDDGANWETNVCDWSGPYGLAAFGTNVYAGPYYVTSIVQIGRNLFWGGYNGMSISTDSGAKWMPIDNGLVHNEIQTVIYQVPVDTFLGQIYYKLDTAYDTVNVALIVNALGSLDTILFAGTRGGIFYSTNYGSEWIVSDTTVKDGGTFATIGTILFLGTGHGVLMSNDKGASWKPTFSKLIDSVTSLLAYRTTLFACTADSGVYLSGDSGSTWMNISAGLNSLRDWCIILKDSDLFVGTDSGIWRRALSDFGISSAVQTLAATHFELQSYPNPFSQSTQISFTSADAGYADISILNLLGEQVARVFSGELPAAAGGEHNFTFSNTPGLPDGMYECIVRMNGRVETLPLVLIR
jgi:ligand-binding sensor domain-containing protein